MHPGKLFRFACFLHLFLHSKSFHFSSSQWVRGTTTPLRFSLRSNDDGRSRIVEHQIEFDLLSSISSIDKTEWDQCLEPDGSSTPFLQHTWLRSLEESGCTTSERGWMPQHVRIKLDGEVSAFIPMYVKSHSMGEFIFDSEWAEYAKENGIEYYPKLLVGKARFYHCAS